MSKEKSNPDNISIALDISTLFLRYYYPDEVSDYQNLKELVKKNIDIFGYRKQSWIVALTGFADSTNSVPLLVTDSISVLVTSFDLTKNLLKDKFETTEVNKFLLNYEGLKKYPQLRNSLMEFFSTKSDVIKQLIRKEMEKSLSEFFKNNPNLSPLTKDDIYNMFNYRQITNIRHLNIILFILRDGMTRKEISRVLGLSGKTIKNDIQEIKSYLFMDEQDRMGKLLPTIKKIAEECKTAYE